MTRPRRYLLRMILFLAAVLMVAALMAAPLITAFQSNAPLNGLIVGVFVIGAGYIFRQVLMLGAEVRWIETYRQNKAPLSGLPSPRLLAPMAAMLGPDGPSGGLRLSALSLRSLLDGIGARLDEARDIARYTTGLLIFLGLLGTFWGLLQTIGAVRDVIAGLGIVGGDITAVFADLKGGLEAPLGGMKTAFSSSLFGLAGALVLGFLDLQAGQAQNRFFNDLEDWLSGQTRLTGGTLSIEGDQGVPAYVEALLERTADSLDGLQRTLSTAEKNRQGADARLTALTEQLGTLNDNLQKMGEASTGGGMDEATRTHIRNLDVYLARLLEDVAQGREDIIAQVRSEVKLLARTIAAKDD